MADPVPPRVLLAAVTSVLIQSLNEEETRGYADDGLRRELDELLARVESDLQQLSTRPNLRLADAPGDQA